MKFVATIFLSLALLLSSSDAQCNMCENVVGIMESWVEANNTVTAIESKFDMLCTLVPAFETVCYGIIDLDVKGVVGYLQRYGDSNTICKKMAMCGGLNVEGGLIKRRAKGGSDQYCMYCEYLFGILENIVASGAGETEVANYLEVICTVFPSEAICQFGLYNVAPVMIEYFTYVADPSTVCYDFGVCEYPSDDEWKTGGADRTSENSRSNEPADLDEDDGTKMDTRAVAMKLHPQDNCNYCTMLVGWLSFYVESDAGVDELKTVFDAYICQITQNMENLCTTIFDDMELVFTFLAQQESPQNICYQLDLCQEQHLLFNAMRQEILSN